MKNLMTVSGLLFACMTGLLLDTSTAMSNQRRTGELALTADIKSVRFVGEDAAYIKYEVGLTLHFVNRGDSPILFFNDRQYPMEIAEHLSSSREDALTHTYLYLSSASPASDKPGWEETRRQLDQKAPPTDLIHVIKPGASWSFDKTIVLGVEIKGSFDKTSKPWDVIRKVDPLWLQLNFMLWPNNLEQNMEDPRFGRRLQRKWKNHGELILANVVSEPIALSLPRYPEKTVLSTTKSSSPGERHRPD